MFSLFRKRWQDQFWRVQDISMETPCKIGGKVLEWGKKICKLPYLTDLYPIYGRLCIHWMKIF
jgi:hypothetical protein